MTRRELLALAPAALAAQQRASLNRRAIVSRHNPEFHAPDFNAPLSVGNGEFAFTVDFTGLQSFDEHYEQTTPLCTQSLWGWHTSPIPDGLDPAQLHLEMFDTYGRQVGYATRAKGQEPLFNWLRENPHRLNLGRIGLLLGDAPLVLEDVTAIDQKLDLWTGVIESRFRLHGQPVHVVTCCHPTEDALALSVTSPLIARGLAVAIDFPYGSGNMNASDWQSPHGHSTRLTGQVVERRLDEDHYTVEIAGAKASQPEKHRVLLQGRGTQLDFVCRFGQKPGDLVPLPASVRKSAADHWANFWSTGAAIDLSGSTDARAQELERRVVLSQYLTAIQCAGSAPPQETGLTCNSWFGKFHLEMHPWHAAHFALWNRTPLLERSLDWYARILPAARDRARQQGYSGVRWPKMTALDGRDSPSAIGPLLIWQQPHPIVLAELCYRAHPGRPTLQRYREIVFESAEFMASYAVEHEGRFLLGPPVIPAQENHPPRETWNPTFELAYWRQGLDIAQRWRESAGLPRNPKWDRVRRGLAALPHKDGVYLAHENCPQTFAERNRDHPSMLYACGFADGAGVDREVMRRTLRKVFDEWQWPETWGWDFPAVAMTAVRLGEPALAIDALFIDSPKNTWRANGHNWQRPNLPVYLPGNGALLLAVAMMSAGWRGSPSSMAPGFPKSGWQMRAENFRPWL